MRLSKSLLWVAGVLAIGLGLAACSATPESCPACPTCPECPVQPEGTVAACAACPTPVPTSQVQAPEPPSCPTTAPAQAVTVTVPFAQEWAGSAHADSASAAFSHWNEEDPQEIPSQCARCHSEPGYLDFLGADGSRAGTVDQPAPVGSVVSCAVCHNPAASDLDVVEFPSTLTVSAAGPEAQCMVCHQGAAAGKMVDEAVQAAGLTAEDTVSRDLGFTDTHSAAAAAWLYGTEVEGGYEYPSRRYDARFDHVEGYDTCVQCHDSHSLEIRVDECAACHVGATTAADLPSIRMDGSIKDYDGDGNLDEGIDSEIRGLQEMLYQGIRAYAQEVAGQAIVYQEDREPYFFADTTGAGDADPADGYSAWTERLAKAAYNYHASMQDAGGYAHGGKYLIELLYDSIDNLNEALTSPIDLSKAHRDDAGHFQASAEAFRHWDEEGLVPRYCSKCHTATGLPVLLEQGVNVAELPSSGLNCATCHDDLEAYTLRSVASVRFPRGAVIDSGDPRTNLCLNCHQGLSSIADVNAATAGLELDTVAAELQFINIHPFAAGATLYGTEVQGAYEYDLGGEEARGYLGRFQHVEGYSNCADCHDVHRQEVKVEACGTCHGGVDTVQDLRTIRMDATDWDGDGDTAEGIAGEIDDLRQALYREMQRYAVEVVRAPMVYDPDVYPHFFRDLDGNGQASANELVPANDYDSWTPRLLRAAYDYQYAQSDPGAFAHNPGYVIQFLYDAIDDLGGDVSRLTRP